MALLRKAEDATLRLVGGHRYGTPDGHHVDMSTHRMVIRHALNQADARPLLPTAGRAFTSKLFHNAVTLEDAGFAPGRHAFDMRLAYKFVNTKFF